MIRKKITRSSSQISPVRNGGEATKKLSRVVSLQEAPRKRDSVGAFEELLRCGLCFQRLLEPKMLPCQHTFCLSCLQTHFTNVMKNAKSPPTDEQLKSINYQLRCPNCKIHVVVSGDLESLKTLPNNVYIDSLLTIVEDTVNLTLDSPITSCPNIRCTNCDTIYELPGKTCEHCRQIFCHMCFTTHVSTLKQTLLTIFDHLDEAKTRLNHRIVDFQNKCTKVNVHIKQVTEIEINNLKQKEKEAILDLDNIKQMEENVAAELFNRVQNLSEEMNQLNFDEITNADQKVNAFMNFHRTTSKIIEEISRCGELKIFFDNKSYKLTVGNDVSTSQTTCENHHLGNNVSHFNPFESNQNMELYYQEKSLIPKLVWKRCPRPAGIGIPTWAPNLLYITTTDQKIVLIMNLVENKVVGKLSDSEMLYPQSVAFCPKRKEIYVSDKWKHCIHVFNQDNEYLRSISCHGNRVGEVRSPNGIVVNDNGELIVCDTGNDRVLILNPETGQQVGILGITESRTMLNLPTDVTIYNDKIYVADSGNHSIKVFLRSGEKVLEFGQLGNTEEQFRLPEVLACDPMGFIVVGDSGNARVQIFKPNGEFVRAFQKSEQLPFSWVSGLLVTPQLDIIATDCRRSSLQII